MEPCAVSGCDGFARNAGMCSAHYERQRRHGDAEIFGPVLRRQKAPADNRCTINGCDAEHYGRGWCAKHHARWRRTGDPLTSRINRDHDRTCQVEGCAEPYESVGMCRNHRRQVKYAEDPSAPLASIAKRRALGGTSVPAAIRRTLPAACVACQSTENLTTDHLIPVSRGGDHSPQNITTLCQACNASKHDLTWDEWRASGRPRAMALFGEVSA